MLNIVPSNQFRRDLKLAKKRGLKLECLTAVINTLAAQKQSKGSDWEHPKVCVNLQTDVR